MTRRMTIAMMASLGLTLFSGSLAFAHEGHDHKVMGTITMAASDHVMLKTTDGKDVTIRVTKDTKVTRDKLAMKPQDVKVGTRVVVTAIEEKGVMKAKEILVGTETKPAAK